jgi:ADP-ribose pyrophosphatase
MRIVQTSFIAQTKFVNLNATNYIDTKGNEKYWIWAERPNNLKAVMVCAYVSEDDTSKDDWFVDRLVVTKEFRVPIGGYEYGFPAGLVNDGEDIVEAARREFKEETGLDIVRIREVSPYVYNSGGLSNESIAIVYCEAEGNISKDGHEDSEDIETFIMTPTEVRNLLATQDNKFSAKAWMIMRQFAEYEYFC